eukprot:CAMPEP_0178984842 /NCGR_PEP_ID=MMETSP0795-20121207/1834_1 /TAXON_ID=88552 /ORGANISM="Amoebophrya sp., Strain Ameob2" /LENGTH=148 /DNA_ID=CAMNT_0020675759 /DNA_START=102 /DNA_END=545 /DNA_ORIENTATION=-
MSNSSGGNGQHVPLWKVWKRKLEHVLAGVGSKFVRRWRASLERKLRRRYIRARKAGTQGEEEWSREFKNVLDTFCDQVVAKAKLKMLTLRKRKLQVLGKWMMAKRKHAKLTAVKVVLKVSHKFSLQDQLIDAARFSLDSLKEKLSKME